MTPYFAGVLVAGALGSLHCVGMCGPLVTAVSGLSAPGRERFTSTLVYQSGRLLSYLTLGLLAGLGGRAIDLGGAAVGLGRLSALVGGGLLVLWGIAAWRGQKLTTSTLVVPKRGPSRPSLASRWLTQVAARPSGERSLLLGLASGLLPCGFLYAFVVAAAGSGSPARALLVMAAFWAGTLPALLGVGLGLGRLAGALRRRVPRLSALVLVTAGISIIALRAELAPPLRTANATQALPAGTGVCPFHRR